MAENQLRSQRGFEPDGMPGVLSMPWATLGLYQLGIDLRLIHICTITGLAVFNRSGAMWHFWGSFFLKINNNNNNKKGGRSCLINNSPFCKMKSEW